MHLEPAPFIRREGGNLHSDRAGSSFGWQEQVVPRGHPQAGRIVVGDVCQGPRQRRLGNDHRFMSGLLEPHRFNAPQPLTIPGKKHSYPLNIARTVEQPPVPGR